jgi:hypothetical protein
MPRSATTGVYTRVSNSFSQPVFGTLIDPTDADAYFDDLDVGLNPPQLDGPVRIIDTLQVGTTGTAAGTVGFFNATSGSITLSPPAGALGTQTLTLPAATDTLVGKATTDVLTNKSFDTAGTGNFLRINGSLALAVTGSSNTVVMNTSPSLVTPALGVATATSINGATIDAQLFSNLPQNSQSAAYTTISTDAQKHILHPVSDNNARTFTIAANASVAYPIGTAITFINRINTVTIAINSDTLILAGTGSTGSRTLGANGIATAIKTAATEWVISGAGLT